MKRIGQLKKAAALLVGAVMCISAAGVQALAAEESVLPSGAALNAAESGDHFRRNDDSMVYDGFSYAKNTENEDTGCIFQYTGDSKKIYIPEEVGGLKIYCLTLLIRDDGMLMDFENDTVEEIFISANIEWVSNDFFDRFKALKRISVSDNNNTYAESDGVLYLKSKGVIQYYPSARDGELNPPKEWQGESYDDMSKIRSITLNRDTVLANEDYFNAAFRGYTSLDKIQIDPDNDVGLKNVGDCIAKVKDGQVILWSCPAPKDTFIIPEGVTDVEAAILSMEAVSNPLRKIVFPSTYDPEKEFIFRGYYHGVYNVTEFEVSSNNPKYKSIDGIVFNKTGETLVCFPSGKTGSYNVPAGITRLDDSSFSCSKLLELSMPDSVISIGDDAIGGCGNLRRIKFSENLEELGFFSVANNDVLEYVELPASLRSIDYCCFYKCPKLKSVKIPETIDDFYGTMYFDESKQEWAEDPDSLHYKQTFSDSPVTIYCAPGSPAEEMAKKENIPYKSISEYDPSAAELPDLNTLGDVDDSGDVNATDALMTLRVSISLDTFTQEQTKRGDTNLDGYITAEDALDILRVSIGFPFSILA